MPPNIDTLLDRLWRDYTAINPQARTIHELLVAQGEQVVNDHIAFRTFDDPRVNLTRLEKPLLALGYKPCGNYTFIEKKLAARHYESSAASGGDSGGNPRPKIFLSELELAKCSPKLRGIVATLLDQIPKDAPDQWDFCASGRPWKIALADYETLAAESEYASWVAAWGFRANHFTVDVGALKSFPTLKAFNDWILSQGFTLNSSGGLIKGSPADLLEQSSTLADQVEVPFTDGKRKIPACYYEFAKRYPDTQGRIFQGFVAKSADKIFESTNSRKPSR